MKTFIQLLLSLVLFQLISLSTEHGLMIEPPARNAIWRFGFPSPPDYGENELFCGGLQSYWQTNKGKCGICGDPYDKERKHETGGIFARNITTRTYVPGGVIDILIDMVANHGGYFQFHMCWRNSFDEKETENCFESLKIFNASNEWKLNTSKRGIVAVSVQLPEDKTCERCILRWHWKSANNWGICENGTAVTGCGPQEVYRNCADVAVSHEYGIRGPFGSNRIDDQKHWNFKRSFG